MSPLKRQVVAVYDPELGRFMSADPFVQAPYNSQSYNRYSYVFNNPLSFTDPSGFSDNPVEEVLVTGVQVDYGFSDFLLASFNSFIASISIPNFVGSQQGSQGVTGFGVLAGVNNNATTTAALVKFTASEREKLNKMGLDVMNDPQDLALAMLVKHNGGLAVVESEDGKTIAVVLEGNSSSPVSEKTTEESNNEKFASAVEKLEGKVYGLGRNGPDQYDCSSTVLTGMRNVKKSIGDYTADEIYNKFTVDGGDKARGTLIFYDYKGDGRMDHVTTILSNTTMLPPSSGNKILEIKSIDYLNNYTTKQGGSVYYRKINWNLISE